MKTAISIPDDLFKTVEEIAEELHLSRSQVFADAVRGYIEKQRNKQILDAINKAYASPETKKETKARRLSIERHARSLKAEKW
jgi:metal-responsive CopG/Arc/MetJ family transcriptional regulator